MPKNAAFTILFVCTGNTCRSPMAQAMLAARLSGPARERIVVGSAGTHAAQGMPASENTRAVLAAAGLGLEEHRSRPVTSRLLDETDLVLAISREHRQAVVALNPGAAERTFVLSEFLASPGEDESLAVHDPIGGSLEIYEETFRRIGAHLDRVLPEILSRAGIP
jgi:protein-tyrosine-phosphatase